MSEMLQVGAGVALVVVFAVLSCGPMVRRMVRRRRLTRRPHTRPTIPSLSALPRTREW